MIEILNPAQLARARVTGALVGDMLAELRSKVGVGTNLLDIDRWTREMIEEAGAESCYVDYAPSFGRGPFGHYICTGVNDAVLHGLPHDYDLAAGDLLSLDLAIVKDEVASDAAIGDISHAIGSVLTDAGYQVNTDFGGHGIGTTMHQDPHIPNNGKAGRGFRLRPGLMLAIEPWVMQDTARLVTDDDGWTLRSATGCHTAHTEHTIVITGDGPEILTLPKSAR